MKRLHPYACVSATILVTICLGAAAADKTPTTHLMQGTTAEVNTIDLSCPRTSNCVNSNSGSELQPLRFAGNPTRGMTLLRATLATYREAEVVNGSPVWLEVIFTTTLGFKDKVDFVVEASRGQIAYRSQSMLGTYDFGKNRSRMKEFTQRFAATAD